MSDYHSIRQREYKILVGQLNSKGIRLEKNLFIAVFNTITNIEWLGHSKQHAIKQNAETREVNQKDIKDALNVIGYKTPRQRKNKYKVPKARETQELDKVLHKSSL